MKEFLADFRKKASEIYQRLEMRQKIVLGSLFILTIVAFVWLISWSTKVEYGLLFGNMDPKEAAKTIEKLDELKIEYRISDGGGTILIPRDQVYETRIKLASEGILTQGGTGYEIFDKSNLGVTEKVQNINFQRALEGELQRTIRAINGIEFVRVHLVFPEERLFKEDQKEPSASVFLRVKQKLNANQVSGITNLIASAVEGLEISRVSITDQDGQELTEHYDDSVAGLSNYQMTLQRKVEDYLKRKIQAQLNNILEPGNSDVRVSADLNFDTIETTTEKYDPESRVARSEEIETTQQADRADSTSAATEHLISNYEINRTVQHITNQVGNIKRLSVSVVVNHAVSVEQIDGEIKRDFTARTPDELSKIESLVRSAVGFDATRGDQIVVSNMRFDDAQQEYERMMREEDIRRQELLDMVEKGVVLLILVILLLALFSQFRKIFARPADESEESLALRPAMISGEAEREGFYPEGEEGMPMGEGRIAYSFKPMKDIEIEQTEDQLLQDAVKKFIIDHPDIAVKLIKSWLIEKEMK